MLEGTSVLCLRVATTSQAPVCWDFSQLSVDSTSGLVCPVQQPRQSVEFLSTPFVHIYTTRSFSIVFLDVLVLAAVQHLCLAHIHPKPFALWVCLPFFCSVQLESSTIRKSSAYSISEERSMQNSFDMAPSTTSVLCKRSAFT